jgi:hypothetical protein
MNVICMLNNDTLYDKAVKEGVPFFQWHEWIQKLINKEVLSKILKKTTPAPKGKEETSKKETSSSSSKETLLKLQAAVKEKEQAK